jgi:antitoxin MazE
LLRVRTRVGRRNTLYIPKGIAEAVGIRENSVVELRVEDGRLVVEVVPDPFELALRGSKFARVKMEDFERESEEMQRELFGEG